MNAQEIEQVRYWVWDNLRQAIDSYDAKRISENDDFIYDICDNIEMTSGWAEEGIFNEADVRMAMGRSLCDSLGIEY